MKNPVKILHLEDDQEDAFLVSRELKKANLNFTQTVVSNAEEFSNALDEAVPDVILSDHTMPSFNSFDALEILRKKNMKIPFILLTGNNCEDFAMTVIKKGADDYIFKDRLQRLPVAITSILEKYELRNTRSVLKKEIVEKSKEAEVEIKRLGNQLRVASNEPGVGIWEWDIENNKLTNNENMFLLCDPEGLNTTSLYLTWLECLHSDDEQRLDIEIQSALEAVDKYSAEFKIKRKDGLLRFIKATSFVERDEKGFPVKMTGAVYDITDKKVTRKKAFFI